MVVFPLPGPPLITIVFAIFEQIKEFSTEFKNKRNKYIFAEIIIDSMSDNKEVDAFYKKLKVQLEETSTFPTQYLYKFIVPTKEDKAEEVMAVFDNMGAVIDTKKSKSEKYTSISIRLEMASADAVIEKYKEVSKIEHVISL